MTNAMTATQHSILTHAHQHTEGKIIWFPDNIQGGARKKVLEGLFNRALIMACKGDWYISAEGYDALGVPHKAPISLQALDAVITAAEQTQPRSRENSKQAQVMAMLKRPEGATIAQIMEATGWQSHTVRGTFAGAFKKKMGLVITSSKAADAERIYRLSA